jgi:hypothetical protein
MFSDRRGAAIAGGGFVHWDVAKSLLHGNKKVFLTTIAEVGLVRRGQQLITLGYKTNLSGYWEHRNQYTGMIFS